MPMRISYGKRHDEVSIGSTAKKYYNGKK